MSPAGACPCGSVRFHVDGPVRDVIVCHCSDCADATGGPWPASAAARADLVVESPERLVWQEAPGSEHGASRGSCRTCGTTVFWDAPARTTVSFGLESLADGAGLQTAAEIWVRGAVAGEPGPAGVPRYPRGLPSGVDVPWRS